MRLQRGSRTTLNQLGWGFVQDEVYRMVGAPASGSGPPQQEGSRAGLPETLEELHLSLRVSASGT